MFNQEKNSYRRMLIRQHWIFKMENKDIIGKKFYRLVDKSYEGDISETGVNGKLSYAGTIKDINNGWITFKDNDSKVLSRNLNRRGYLFVDLEEILFR